MAYKQSPFPMIEGTSPVKYKKWLAQKLIKYGAKIKTAFSKKPKWQGREMTKSTHPMKTGHYKTVHPQKGTTVQPKITGHTYPGAISTKHPKFMQVTNERLKASQKYWYNPLKK